LTPELIEAQKVDDHHVFPRAYLRDLGRGGETDSVLNHVLIDRATNILIGKNPPSKYLTEIRAALGDGVDTVLESHGLPPESDTPLMKDDVDSFLTWRLEHLDELLAAKTGRSEPPALGIAPHLRALDARIEQVELSLRQLVHDRLNGNASMLPPHVEQKVRDRIDTAARKQPALARQGSPDLPTQLQYFDLRELQDTITTKKLWPEFADIFATKETLLMRFGQLVELRNAIRHSRQVTPVTRNDGEAALGWFGDILAGLGTDSM
jgi:hypothetical protein